MIWKIFIKGIFEDDVDCTFNFEEIELYYQILLPLYKLNLSFERTDSHIGEVIPLLLLLKKGILERIKLDGEEKKFIDLLIKNLNKKFNYELNSKIYLAASVLECIKNKNFFERSFGKNILKKGLDALVDTVLLLKDQDELKTSAQASTKTSKNSQTQNTLLGSQIEKDLNDIFSEYFKSKSTENLASCEKSVKEDVEKEKNLFLNLLKGTHYSSSFYFWNLYEKKLPILSSLAKR